MEAQRFFLVGLPGSGKTTLGKELAKLKGIPFMDLDQEIIRVSTKSIPEIFEKNGEELFRKIENESLLTILGREESFVLATGGGTPCFFDNMKQMNNSGITIYINTPLEEIKRRLENDTGRPLMKRHTLEELHANRKSFYEQASKTITSGQQISEL